MRNGAPITSRVAYATIAEAMMLPRMIKLGENLYGAAFHLMKLLPADFMLKRARDAKLVRPGAVVIETSSGTFGLALAILCNLLEYRLILVSDPAIEPPLKRRLEDLSATIELVEKPAPTGGFQQARLDRLAELQATYPEHFWPCQYDNPHNPGAYSPFAELLAEVVGEVDCLVGSVGSGGSMCGTTGYLRILFPNLIAAAVDTHGSVLFGQPDKKRMLRGLGNSLMPKNLDHSAFDFIHWVSAAEAFAATRAMHQEHGLYLGPTSGAAYLVAKWFADTNPEMRVVALFPDEGYRYENSVYDDHWLTANDLMLRGLPRAPRLVDHPFEAGANWSFMRWGRRAYEKVLGGSFKAGTA